MTTKTKTPPVSFPSRVIALGAMFYLLLAGSASAGDRAHELRWLQPDPQEVSGFDVYLSLEPNSASIGIDIGMVTADSDDVHKYSVEGLDDFTDYYVVMTAYNFNSGLRQESGFSNQLMIPAVDLCIPTNCDDGNPCTVDTCTASGCTNVMDSTIDGCGDGSGGDGNPDPDCLTHSDCGDDGNVCNGTPQCLDGSCMPGQELVCAESTECTISFCDIAGGCQSVNVSDGTGCSAGSCQHGSCVSDETGGDNASFGVTAITGISNGGTFSGQLDIRAMADSGTDSVKFFLNGAPFRIENTAPYSFNGDSGGNVRLWDTTTKSNGTYSIKAVGYDAADAAGQTGTSVTITFEINNSPASEDEDPDDGGSSGLGVHTLTGVSSGDVVSGQIDVRALVGEGTMSVRFRLDGKSHRIENSAPFTFNGDKNGEVNLFDTNSLSNGTHKIKATGYELKRGKGQQGTSVEIVFTVQN